VDYLLSGWMFVMIVVIGGVGVLRDSVGWASVWELKKPLFVVLSGSGR